MSIILAGVSHHNTPLEVRERFFISEQALPEELAGMARYQSLKESVILSTCNRVEFYSYTDNYENGIDALYEFLRDSRRIRAEELKNHLYVHSDEDAMRHLFSVASSLDSMVLGEPQILGQVKDAYQVAEKTGHTGKSLTSLFTRAFRVAKKVRDQTVLGKKAVSVSSVASELANKIFGSLKDRTVLLLGAGEMAELAATHLVGHGARTVLVANRTFSRAEALASSLGGRAVNYDNISSEMAQADIVIASTGAPHMVVNREMVESALDARRDTPIFLIDIAVPRDIDPAVNDLENVYLYDIDDLQSVVASNIEGREEGAVQARSIVKQELEKYLRRVQLEDLSQTFSAIRIEAESQREGEVAKTLSRLPDLGDKERQVIESMSRAIVNKLLHQPFEALREMNGEEWGEESLTIIQRLFGVEPGPEEDNASGPDSSA